MTDVRPLSLDEVCDALLAAERPLVLSHTRPDGDTVGAAAALLHLLIALGKRPAYLLPDPLPRRLAFLSEGLALAAAEENRGGTVITVDVASPAQLGTLSEEFADRVALMIDHHASATPMGPYFTDPDAAACGELIYAIGMRLLARGALASLPDGFYAAVYAAISSDTACFRLPNTTADTHKIAGALLSAGVPAADINRALFDSRTQEDLAADAIALSGLSLHADGRIAVISLPFAARKGLADEHFETAIDIARSLAGVEIAATLRELSDGKTKISLRSTAADVSAICRRFGGGGHVRAAGATADGAPDALLPVLLPLLEEALEDR